MPKNWRNSKVEGSVSQWQSLCLALTVSFAAPSAAFPQASANMPEISSGDVWLLPSDQISPALVVPQVSPSKGEVPTGDVWLVPARPEAPALATEQAGQQDAALATTNK